MNVKLISHTIAPEELIAEAYGICTGKNTIPVDNIQKWMKQGHETPLEHAVATFRIEDISRVTSHQLVRHRLASYSQSSQRYIDQEFRRVIPKTISGEWHDKYKDAIDMCYDLYYELIENGIAREDARYILPQCLTTSLIMTANFREWRHILKLRLDKHAQWEIRELAYKILEQLYEIAPKVFEDLKGEYNDI